MYSIKFSYKEEVRRVQLATENSSFSQLSTTVKNLYPEIKNKQISLLYRDEENDLITVTTDEELAESFRVMSAGSTKLLRYTIKIVNEADVPVAEKVGVKSPQGLVHHFGVTCDECGMVPISGTRYKCTVREDFDLCSACEASKTQPYPMIKIEDPAHAPEILLYAFRDKTGAPPGFQCFGGKAQGRRCGGGGRGGFGRHCGPFGGRGGPHPHRDSPFGFHHGPHHPHHTPPPPPFGPFFNPFGSAQGPFPHPGGPHPAGPHHGPPPHFDGPYSYQGPPHGHHPHHGHGRGHGHGHGPQQEDGKCGRWGGSDIQSAVMDLLSGLVGNNGETDSEEGIAKDEDSNSEIQRAIRESLDATKAAASTDADVNKDQAPAVATEATAPLVESQLPAVQPEQPQVASVSPSVSSYVLVASVPAAVEPVATRVDEPVSAPLSAPAAATTAGTATTTPLWRRELQLLNEMGFDDVDVLIPLLQTHMGTPSSLKGGEINEVGIQRIVAILLR